MASACVEDNIGTTYRCLSPRVPAAEEEDDFEFCLEDHPSAMLPADELFSDGKLVPLKLSSNLQAGVTERSSSPPPPPQESEKPSLRMAEVELEISGMTDPHNSLFSPKAPRCTTRWRELLGLKNNNKLSSQNPKSSEKSHSSSSPSSNNHNKHSSSSTLKQYFLHRSSKQSSSSTHCSSSSSSLNLRLLKDLDMSCESLSISSSSSRLSLSSSSSSGGHELDNIDLPRLSLDSDKPGPPNPFAPARRIRMASKPQQQPTATEHCSGSTAAADSPRMNPSGKIVFHGLGRSSSSPAAGCNFNNGGSRSRLKSRGMERSYSANVRITPVLNVPLCSLRGSSKNGLLGQLFSSSSSSSSPNKNGTGGNNRVRLHSTNGFNGKVVKS